MARRITVSRIIHRSRLAYDAASDSTHSPDGRIEDRTAHGRRRCRPAVVERAATAAHRSAHRDGRRRNPAVRLPTTVAVPRAASIAHHASSAGRVISFCSARVRPNTGRVPLPRIRASIVVAGPVCKRKTPSVHSPGKTATETKARSLPLPDRES